MSGKEGDRMIGCLCIHGFTGAPYEVEPLAQYLKQKTDWNVQSVTLPGHGDELQLKGILYQEWIATAELELLFFTEHVIPFF